MKKKNIFLIVIDGRQETRRFRALSNLKIEAAFGIGFRTPANKTRSRPSVHATSPDTSKPCPYVLGGFFLIKGRGVGRFAQF